ncbi:MAG: DHHA1 domain-containing protein [Patescibacteria group bacterium]|nr:DHHA1 domain-containing protein [Patescibacteria group bacterium]
MKKRILIIYHDGCFDGFTSAWAAWKKFGNGADYFGASRVEEPPDVRGKIVYCIDFTYEPDTVVKKMKKDAKRLILIDHHITAEPRMKFASESLFSVENSAAVLAWKYFFPKKPVPQLSRYVEDGDLWRFKLPHSKEIGAYIGLHDFNFKAWSTLAKELESAKGRKKAREHGAELLRYQDGVIKNIAARARTVVCEGKKVLAVNSSVFESPLGHLLAEQKPPFGIVWREEGDMIKVSLRASGSFDVSKIAEKYGGGGHRAAAGFLLKRGEKFPWK